MKIKTFHMYFIVSEIGTPRESSSPVIDKIDVNGIVGGSERVKWEK